MDRAAAAGMRGVEFSAEGGLPDTTPDTLARARDYAAERGLNIVADGGVIEEEALRRWLPRAKGLGIGVSSAFVSRILGGKKPVCGRVLQDLGFERVRAFRKKPAVIGHARGEVSSCDAGRSG